MKKSAAVLTALLVILTCSLSVSAANAESWTLFTQWALVQQVHSPAYGGTSLTTGLSYSTEFMMVGIGGTSSLSSSTTIAPQNGQCCAVFQAVRWLYHEWWILWWHFEELTIVEVLPYVSIQNIYGNSCNTCSDDVEQINYNGWESMIYDAQYVSSDTQLDNNSDTPFIYTVSATSGNYISSGMSVSVGIPGVGVSQAVYNFKHIN